MSMNKYLRNSEQAIHSLGENELLNDTAVQFSLQSLAEMYPTETKSMLDLFVMEQLQRDGRKIDKLKNTLEKISLLRRKESLLPNFF